MTDDRPDASPLKSPVALVVPCFNEAARLDVQTFACFELPKRSIQIYFVDDGSTDGTAATLDGLARARPGRVRVLRLASNRGKGEAVRQGLLAALDAGAGYVGYWDADLATPLDELEGFCRLLDERPELELVLGARVQMLGRAIDRRPLRHYYGRVFATVVSRMLRLPVYDTQCGAKLLRASPRLHAALREPFVTRWLFDVELLLRYGAVLSAEGLALSDRVYEQPLRAWRDVPGSKVSLRDAALVTRDLRRIARRYHAELASR
ncbi:MAG: glycosyltransferase [Myxococcales bacterium]|nr:glycosyltransferase [Myxococcales bacterium]